MAGNWTVRPIRGGSRAPGYRATQGRIHPGWPIGARALLLAAALTVFAPSWAPAEPIDDGVKAYEAGDYETAWQILLPLGQSGDAEAQYRLGLMREYGTGILPNDYDALSWYRAAASSGHAEAQYRLGLFLEAGRGVPMDVAGAVQWFRSAADQELPAAKGRLGRLLIDGLGVEPDERRGRALLEQAAAAGDADSADFLARRYPPPPPPVVIESTEPPSGPGSAATPEAPSAVEPPPSVGQALAGRVVVPPADPGLSPEARELRDLIVAEVTRMVPYGIEIRMATLAIEQAGPTFHVAMPDLALIGIEDGVSVRLDTLEFDVTPTGQSTYRVVAIWPALVTVHDRSGREVANITFGERSFEGTWAPELGGYLDQRLHLANVVLSVPDMGFEVRAKRIAYEAALEPSGNGRVTGPSAFSLGDFSLANHQGQNLFTIGSLKGTSTVRGLNRGLLARLNEGAIAMTPGGAPDLSFLPATLGDIIGDAAMDVTIQDLTFSDPTGGASGYIARLAYAMAVVGLDGPLARIEFSYRHDGLALGGDADSALAPKAFNLDLSVDRLPAADLYAMLLNAGIASFANPGAGDALLAGLPAVFVRAATELRVDALDLSFAGAEAHGSGSLTGDPASTGGVVGTFSLVASRLDRAIETLTQASENQDAMQAAFFLTMVQGMGAPETDSTGDPVLAYRLEIDATGAKLNGQDLDAMMSGAMGTQP